MLARRRVERASEIILHARVGNALEGSPGGITSSDSGNALCYNVVACGERVQSRSRFLQGKV